MKRALLACMLLGIFTIPVIAQSKVQRGTIIRMQMAECLSAEHGFMAALSGASHTSSEGVCPEYVLVADKVVFVIVGRSSTALVPLAETTKFRFQNNELLIRIDDARKESRFAIREMVLRSEWDRAHPHTMEAIDSGSSPHRIDSAVLVGQEQ
ncbi:MAG TPA: hypothetical protein VJQ82_22430 [Terriglobales bacterium]|nr:hypothetical protein [Terriglobales bacterium]